MRKTLKLRTILLLAVVLFASVFGLLSMNVNAGQATADKYTEVFTKQQTSIRLKSDVSDISGIRFIATADLTDSGISGDAEFGFLIAKTADLNGNELTFDLANFDDVAVKLPAAVFVTKTETQVVYQAVIKGIPESDYGVDITAVPYVIDGGVQKIAEDKQDCSIAEVASVLISQGYEYSDLIKDYVNKVAEDITLTAASEVELTVGDTLDLGVAVIPADLTPAYATTDSGVATVANGVVTAVAAGNATITVSVGEIVKTVAVTVKEEVKVYAEDVFYANDSAAWAATNTEAFVGTYMPTFEGESNVIKYVADNAPSGTAMTGLVPMLALAEYQAAGYTHVSFKLYVGHDVTGEWYLNKPANGMLTYSATAKGWSTMLVPIADLFGGSLNFYIPASINGTFAITEAKAIKSDTVYANNGSAWAATNTEAFVGTYMSTFEGESNVIKYVATDAPNGTAMTGLVPVFSLDAYKAAGYTHVTFKLYVGYDVTGEWYLDAPIGAIANLGAAKGWTRITLPIENLCGGVPHFFIPASISGTFAITEAKAIKIDTFYANDSAAWAATNTEAFVGTYMETFEGESNVIKYVANNAPNGTAMTGLVPKYSLADYQAAGYTHVTFKLYVGHDVTGEWYLDAPIGAIANLGAAKGWTRITLPIENLCGGVPHFFIPASISGTFAITQAKAIKDDAFWTADGLGWAATSNSTLIAGSYEKSFKGEQNVIKYSMNNLNGSVYLTGLAPVFTLDAYKAAGYTHVTFKFYVGGDVTGTWFFTAPDGDPSMAVAGSVPAGWNTITIAIDELGGTPYFWCAGGNGTFAITAATAVKVA